ncbi:MAG: hypothetical protein JWQ88_281 [Rhodoferax sp.]|nr:hypothetical protein [Rhodoferax sp.]
MASALRTASAPTLAEPAEASIDVTRLTYPNGRGGRALEVAFQQRSVGCWLEYKGSFRAGTITYREGPLRIAFPHRCGRDCRFFITIPAVAEWETATGTALARRDDIVDFVAETVRREEAGSWRVEIGARRIRYK